MATGLNMASQPPTSSPPESDAPGEKTISVAMAVYNGERYIRRQLDSIAGQTLRPTELVICDDLSTDATEAIIADFARASPFPVRYRKNDARLGYRRNFFQCVNLCRGDLIAFCDQDDIWLPLKLSTQAARFDQVENLTLSFHNSDLVDETGSPLDRTYFKNEREEILTFDTIGPFLIAPGFCQMFRRDLLAFSDYAKQVAELYDPTETISHDRWFFFIAGLFGPVHYDPISLAHYRQHRQNASGQLPDRRTQWRRQLLDRRVEYEMLVGGWRSRLDIMRVIQASLGSDDGGEAGGGLGREIRVVEAFLQRAERRLLLYHSDSRLTLARTLLSALLNKDYASGEPWSFPPRGFLRDLLLLAAPRRDLPETAFQGSGKKKA